MNVVRTGGAFIASAAIVVGALYLPHRHLYVNAAAFSHMFALLAPTAVLIGISLVIALLCASLIALLLRNARTRGMGNVLSAAFTALVCVPVFALGLGAQTLFPNAGVGNLLLPATLLACMQIAPYADCLRRNGNAAQLFGVFVRLLPVILSADVLVEIFFARPGIGREFVQAMHGEASLSYITAYFMIAAAIVALARAAGAFMHADDTKADVVEVL